MLGRKLTFKVVATKIKTQQEVEEEEKLRDLGLPVDDEITQELMRYSFVPHDIVEYRETYVMYKGNYEKGVICTYSSQHETMDTPILLCTVEEFEEEVNKLN